MKCPKVIKSPFYLQTWILRIMIFIIINILLNLISWFKLNFDQIRSFCEISLYILQSFYLDLLRINNLCEFILSYSFQSLNCIFLQFFGRVRRIFLIFHTAQIRLIFLFFIRLLIFEWHCLFIVKINKSIVKIIN